MVKALVYESEIIAEMLIADSFISRFLGYMFIKSPHYEAILIKPCNSIHTFCMRFPIDVLFVNENMEVLKKIEGLKPGKIIMPQKKCKMVIEAGEGRFKNIKAGSKLDTLQI